MEIYNMQCERELNSFECVLAITLIVLPFSTKLISSSADTMEYSVSSGIIIPLLGSSTINRGAYLSYSTNKSLTVSL